MGMSRSFDNPWSLGSKMGLSKGKTEMSANPVNVMSPQEIKPIHLAITNTRPTNQNHQRKEVIYQGYARPKNANSRSNHRSDGRNHNSRGRDPANKQQIDIQISRYGGVASNATSRNNKDILQAIQSLNQSFNTFTADNEPSQKQSRDIEPMALRNGNVMTDKGTET